MKTIVMLAVGLLIAPMVSQQVSADVPSKPVKNIILPSKEEATNTVFHYSKLKNSARLHNASANELDTLTAQSNVFTCIGLLQDTRFDWTTSLNLCDDTITNEIVNHQRGNNQTVLNLAHAYLKARGIQ